VGAGKLPFVFEEQFVVVKFLKIVMIVALDMVAVYTMVVVVES